jgi:membrane associated rhomboid family serine protease
MGRVTLGGMPDTLSRSLPWSIPLALIASVVIVSVLSWLVEPLRRALILNPYQVRTRGQVYRLLTAGWLHGDVAHLIVNMLTLYFFADQVLRVLGEARFLVLYVSAVIVASIPSTLRHMRDPRYNTLGASGAVAAVMFSAVLLYPKLKLTLMFLPIPVPGLLFAAGYLVYSAWRSYSAGDNINHSAHFFGAAYGAILTYFFEPSRVERTLKQLF